MSGLPDEKPNLPIEFTALLLHDLEGPFAVAKQFLKRVEDGRHDPNNPKHRKLVASTQLAIQRGERILEDLLDQVRAGASGITLHLTLTNLLDLITNSVDMVYPLMEDKGLLVSLPDKSAFSTPVSLDAGMMTRVIDNLLVNAIRHASNHSTIKIQGEINESTVWIDVINTSESDVFIEWDKIFDLTYQVQMRSQRRMRGTGLGLTFCENVVKAHGGTIAAHTQLGKVIFHLELPSKG